MVLPGVAPIRRLPDLMGRLVEAGVQYGRSPGAWNPKMASYLLGERSKVYHLFDLDQTAVALRKAANFVTDITADGGHVMFVGRRKGLADQIKETALRVDMPYYNVRWRGGIFSNWKVAANSVDRLIIMDHEIAENETTQQIKPRELALLKRRWKKLDKAFGGLRMLEGGRPDAIFLFNPLQFRGLVRESFFEHIPIIGVVDSSDDPTGITYPIPGNSTREAAIRLYLDIMATAVERGRELWAQQTYRAALEYARREAGNIDFNPDEDELELEEEEDTLAEKAERAKQRLKQRVKDAIRDASPVEQPDEDEEADRRRRRYDDDDEEDEEDEDEDEDEDEAEEEGPAPSPAGPARAR
eukprot:tig00000388_g24806.t1